jgi:hypothetical protein
MNQRLFTSALLYGIIILFVLLCAPPTNHTLIIVIIAGIITSLWNHGTTSHAARISDRLVMAVGAVFLLYLSVNLEQMMSRFLTTLMLLAAIGFYLTAKATATDEHHLIAHTLLIGVCVILIMNP